jgi:hypothetical protein
MEHSYFSLFVPWQESVLIPTTRIVKAIVIFIWHGTYIVEIRIRFKIMRVRDFVTDSLNASGNLRMGIAIY